MITYGDVLQKLNALADERYRIFHSRLLKNEKIRVLGVKVPLLRALAKEWKGELETLLSFPDEYYEVTFLKCQAVALLPFEAFCKNVERVLPLIDNWATCDSFRPNCLRAHKREFLPYVERYCKDEREFIKRFGLVTLLVYYVEEAYLPLLFEKIRACKEEPYYVMTACAWLLAEILIKHYDAGVSFLKENCIPPRTRDCAVQKATESFRISPAQKLQLKALRNDLRIRG